MLLLECHEWVSESRSVVSESLWCHGLYSPWNSPGQNTGVGSHSLLQEIFPTQGSNPGLPHCRQILYQLSHQGSPIPSSADFPNPEIELGSPALQVDSLPAELPGTPGVPWLSFRDVQPLLSLPSSEVLEGNQRAQLCSGAHAWCLSVMAKLEKEMATHSTVLAWRIPGTGSLVGCRLWGHTESDTTEVT